jgi:ferredoxin
MEVLVVVEDHAAAIQAIRNHATDEEKPRMYSLLKAMPADERTDLWTDLTHKELVDTLRVRLESGGPAFGLHACLQCGCCQVACPTLWVLPMWPAASLMYTLPAKTPVLYLHGCIYGLPRLH